jgi:hypothetical protein
MKVTVITGTGGKIVGTAHHGITGNPEAGYGGPVAGKAQSASVIDLPAELEGVTDADSLHSRLKSHFGSEKKRKK